MTFTIFASIQKYEVVVFFSTIVRFLRLLHTLLLVICISPFLISQDGPLGEWPEFTPQGYITAPHPMDPSFQTHLYGDWGGIVGEEFLVIEDSLLKLFYHSYHETYLTTHLHEEEILKDWELAYDTVSFQKFNSQAQPGGPFPGPSWDHTDTPGYLHHPRTGERLLYNTVRPGTKHMHPEWAGLPGWIGAIQVSTRIHPPGMGKPFDQTYENILEEEYWWELGWDQNGVIKGGLSEPTPVWAPHLGDSGMVRLFYRGLNGAPGSYWNWRISYADSEDGKTNWEKKGIPTWDPSDPSNPAYQWSLPYPQGFNFRGSWHAHCTGDTIADGVHMILCVSNQNYAGMGHLAYYWSPDWGDTWIGHPDNPIIAPGQFENGVPPEGFQRTPTIIVDEDYNRYIIAYNAGHDAQEPWKRRTYIATASRPIITEIGEYHEKNDIPILVYPNPSRSNVVMTFSLQHATHVQVNIYNTMGQHIVNLRDGFCEEGEHSITWNIKEEDSITVLPGLYIVKLHAGSKVFSAKFLVIPIR